jgi:hypothetical protein
MSSHLLNLNHRNSSYACKSVFFVKGPAQGQIPGLLGHGPQIVDRTIDHCKATDLCFKFSSPLGATAAEKKETDGLHNDFVGVFF